MIEHTVTFRLRHSAGSPEERAFLEAAGRLALIAGVRDFAIRRQVNGSCDHTFGITMRFLDRESYESYSKHPLHTAFVRDRWLPEVASFQEADFMAYDGL